MSVFAVGLFKNLIAASEAQGLCKEKIVVCDSSRIDTLLVIPICNRLLCALFPLAQSGILFAYAQDTRKTRMQPA